jgi:hypothetical protein
MPFIKKLWVSAIVCDLPQLLTDYYKAYGKRHASIYRPYDEAKLIENTDIITCIKDITARFMNNLTASTLKDFEHDVLKQLNDDGDLNNIRQLLYKTRDEAIEKIEKLERGWYNIQHAVFGLI